MTLTRARTIQYIGILSSLLLIAVGYWYFSVRAGVKTNTSNLQAPGFDSLALGLAGYWRFDDGSGSTVTDSSTNGNNGTQTGGMTWTTGQINGAGSFDGSNDQVTVAAGTSIVNASQNVTLSTWVYFRTIGSYKGIIFKNSVCDEATSEYMLELNVSGFISFWMNGTQLNSGVMPSTGQWYHITATNSAAGSAIYLNGTRIAAGSAMTAPSSSSDDWVFGACNNLDGNLDEIRIYDRSLSSDEVANLYRLTTPTGVDTSLKGYWSFNSDALSGTTAYDRSGAGNTGTLTNGPTNVEGITGQALRFDGSNDEVSIPDSAALSPTTALTYTFWAKRTDVVSSDGMFVAKSDGGGGRRGTGVRSLAGGGIAFHTATDANNDFSSSTVASGLVQQNQWVYVVAVFDGAGSTNADRAKVYVNGLQQALSFGGSVPTSTPDTVAPLSIGGNFTYPYFPGVIDEVRFYNRALSASEIKAQYDAGAPDKANTSAGQRQGAGNLDSGLTAYWRLDETTGSTASDSSTNANNATLSNMENGDWVTGQIGNGLDFDGSNEYVSASASPIASHSSGTITAWIKSTNGSAAQTIFGFSTTASSDYAGFLGTNSVGKLQFRIKGNGSDLINCGVTDSGSSAQVAASGTWTFVAITNDGTGKKMYKNGSLQGTDCGSDTTWLSALSAQPPVDASIGAWLVAGAPQSLFQGSIDEVRVYNRAFSSEEIGQLYRLTTPTAVDTGLKGYWSFNGSDLSGTTAYDRSGVSSTGTLTNGPAVVEGVNGQALRFDGSDDYVTVPHGTTSDPTTQITLSAWVKRSGIGSQQFIIGKGRAASISNNYYILQFTASNLLNLTLADTTTVYSVSSNSTITDTNSWHHIVGTWDGATMRLFINGIQDKNTAAFTGPLDVDNDDLTIGNRGVFFNRPFHGILDEVRIYNRAITSSEIKAQYDAGNPDKSNTSASQPQGTGRLDSGLVAYYPLDNGSGTTATDTSTNGNNGTLTNGPTWTTGQVGGAVDFDGSDDYIELADLATIESQSTVTFAAWVRPDSLTGNDYGAFFCKYNSGTDDLCFQIGGDGGIGSTTALVGTIRNGSDTYGYTGNDKLTVGTWSHVAMVFDGRLTGNSNRLKIYVNGVSETLTFNGTIPATTTSNSVPLRIGRTGAASNYWNGLIDEARVYNRALSDEEVRNLSRLATPTGTDTGLKGYWSFNGQDMNNTIAVDRSGAGNNGTLTNGPAITEGKLGQALSFDGSDDHVSVPDSPSLSSTTAFSVSFWALRTGVVNSGRNYIRKTDTGDRSWVIGTGDFGVISFTIASDVNDSGSNYVTTPNGVVVSGQWVHVTAVFDGSGSTSADRAKIYANGALQPVTVTGTIATSAVNNSAALNIGGLGGGGDLFPGKIDEVRYYSRALSANEIKALYDSGR